jgi:hypothetical protein
MAAEAEFVDIRPRRVNPFLVALAGVAVLALLGWFLVRPLVFPESEESTPAPSGQAASRPSPAPAPAQPAETFEVFESKDPFRPLVLSASTGGSAGSPSSAAAPGQGVAGAPAPSGGQRVALLDVFEDPGTKAQVKVGSTVYTVSPGETFAGNFKLVSVSGRCATLLHGDDKFTLCEGEEVIK